jgi:hypothetical protein
MKYRGEQEDSIFAVYFVADGEVDCKVGFLAQHLAANRADEYDGLA